MKNHVKLITVAAVTMALTAVLGLFPYVFLVPVLFTCVTRDWKMSVLEGMFFGVLSFCYAFISPTPVAQTFIANPWIPILPRILVALGCHGTYVGFKKLLKGKGKAYLWTPATVACVVGSLLNTALVVPCLIWRGGDLFIPILGETMIAAVIEVTVAAVVVPPLAVTVGKALRLPGYLLPSKPAATNPSSDAAPQENAAQESVSIAPQPQENAESAETDAKDD